MERLTIKDDVGVYCPPNVPCETRCDVCKHLDNMMNKLAQYEEAEEQGLLLRLPVAIGDMVWTWEFPTRIYNEDTTWVICDIKRATIVSKKFNLFMLDRFGESYFTTKEEAEQELANRQNK